MCEMQTGGAGKGSEVLWGASWTSACQKLGRAEGEAHFAAQGVHADGGEEQPGDAHEEVEIPGAIFSYPILRQQGEPILDEGTPPPPTPHRPLMPSITLADEDDEESGSVVPAPMTRPTAPAAPAPQKTAKAQTKRRRKAIMALRALHRKIGD